MKKPKKRANKPDLTIRNARAYNKRLKKIEQWLEGLTYDVNTLFSFMNETEAKLTKKRKARK